MPSAQSEITPLTPEQFQRLNAFVGYGNPDGSVWFIGMEEGGGTVPRLLRQTSFEPIEDLRDAHITKLGITRWHRESPPLQSTWNKMSYILLSLRGIEPTVANRRNYQAERLGRLGQDTLLAELIPIPNASTTEWPYAGLHPDLASRETYVRSILPSRIDLFRQLVGCHAPALIVAYGKGYWPHYRQTLPDAGFIDNVDCQVGSCGGTTMVLTHHLAARTMNGRHQALLDVITRHCPDIGSRLGQG